ncbi:hypothetical protein SAMN05216464_118101 [Mucilaginibacter pineti]|uniref:Uncharacterized protein n=1 Tax=Mucilaginibacter pineti TaxID=1391627 RepID=A0A1G7LC34_9SPHI|nr:hypothetical protein [Mucilaginibacter pineti]SDF46600.1 hypothetical protein SAMN05216464_118101 [Mucilaginibacter pineti]
MATNVMAQVYETLLCSPGMNEAVKVDVKINRKTVLLLNSVIERGLTAKDGEQGLLELIPKETVEELQQFSDECLKKAGLTELSEKMKGWNTK